MTPRHFLVISALSVACSGSRAATTHTAAPTPEPATASAAPDASAPAAPPADPRREAVLAAFRASTPNPAAPPAIVGEPIDYPDESGAARAAAVVAVGDGATLVVTPVPYAEGQQATASLLITGAPAETVAGLSARDVNGDHKADVAVFLRREYELENYAPLQHFALFYTPVTAPEREMKPLIRAEVELLGVRNDAELEAAIPTLGRYEAPREGLSPARFIARLRYATPAELRQATAPAGVRLCTDVPDRTGTRRKRCTPYTAARLTDALVTGRVRRDLGTFADVLADDTHDLTFPSCQRQGNELRCNANRGGPDGVDWSVVGEGASLRVVEISPWAEGS